MDHAMARLDGDRRPGAGGAPPGCSSHSLAPLAHALRFTAAPPIVRGWSSACHRQSRGPSAAARPASTSCRLLRAFFHLRNAGERFESWMSATDRGHRRRTAPQPPASPPGRPPSAWRGGRGRSSPSPRCSRAAPSADRGASSPVSTPAQMFSARPPWCSTRYRQSLPDPRPSTPGTGARRRALHQRDELLGIHGGDGRGVEQAAQPLLQAVGTAEGPLHRHLLVEQHADQQRQRVGVEEPRRRRDRR